MAANTLHSVDITQPPRIAEPFAGILARYELLDARGFGPYRAAYRRQGESLEAWRTRDAALHRERRHMLEQQPHAFTALSAWVETLPMQATINRRLSSYIIALLAEQVLKCRIHSGICCAVFIAQGFLWERTYPKSPDLYFNVSYSAIINALRAIGYLL